MIEMVGQKVLGLQYFGVNEFGEWWFLMDVDFLQKVDLFCYYWGVFVIISLVLGGLGCYVGKLGSYYNIDKWGVVCVLDVFLQGLIFVNVKWVVECVEKVGLGGIGLYIDIKLLMMIYLDNWVMLGCWLCIVGQY